MLVLPEPRASAHLAGESLVDHSNQRHQKKRMHHLLLSHFVRTKQLSTPDTVKAH